MNAVLLVDKKSASEVQAPMEKAPELTLPPTDPPTTLFPLIDTAYVWISLQKG